MAKLSFAAIPVSAAAVAFLCTFAVTNSDEPPKPQKSINVSELQGLQVIGYLGQPLGKIVTVEGVIADGSYTNTKADAGATLLRINTVDGKELQKEQVFQLSRVDKPKVGSKFKYVGYETGGFTESPPAHLTIRLLSQAAVTISRRNFGFCATR